MADTLLPRGRRPRRNSEPSRPRNVAGRRQGCRRAIAFWPFRLVATSNCHAETRSRGEQGRHAGRVRTGREGAETRRVRAKRASLRVADGHCDLEPQMNTDERRCSVPRPGPCVPGASRKTSRLPIDLGKLHCRRARKVSQPAGTSAFICVHLWLESSLQSRRLVDAQASSLTKDIIQPAPPRLHGSA
jgi:hypothetical protein